MHEADSREEMYREARGELLRRIEHDGLAGLPEHERRTEIARYVRSLCERWPGLDGQLSRRLLAETLDGGEGGEGRAGTDAPSSGHANVTTLRRDDRQWVR